MLNGIKPYRFDPNFSPETTEDSCSEGQITPSSSAGELSGLDSFKRSRSGSSESPPRAVYANSRREISAASQASSVDALGPSLAKSDLRPGDILLLIDEAENTTKVHRVIVFGQSLTSLANPSNSGDSNLVHAVLWTKTPNNPGNTAPAGAGEPEIAESSGVSGRVQGTALRAGLYKVYRPTDENLGDWSAQVAMGWGQDRQVEHSRALAMLAIFHSSAFGPDAKKWASIYAEQAFNPSPDIGQAFCTQFVLAAYQGAASQVETPIAGALSLDARRTSPRMLEHALKSDPNAFSGKGHIRIKAEDVLYPEAPPGLGNSTIPTVLPDSGERPDVIKQTKSISVVEVSELMPDQSISSH